MPLEYEPPPPQRLLLRLQLTALSLAAVLPRSMAIPTTTTTNPPIVAITSPTSCATLTTAPNAATAPVRLVFEVNTDVITSSSSSSSSRCCVMAVVSGPSASSEVWHFDVPPSPIKSSRTVRVCSPISTDSDVDGGVGGDAGPTSATTSSKSSSRPSTTSLAADDVLWLAPGYYHVAAHFADDAGALGLPPAEMAFRVLLPEPEPFSDFVVDERDAAADLASAAAVKVARRAKEERTRREETTLTLAQYRRRHPRLWGPWRALIHPLLLDAIDGGSGGDDGGYGQTFRGGGGGGGGRWRRLRGLLKRATPSGLHALTVPILTDETRLELIEEIEHAQASGLKLKRPNSMNKYGLILHEIGLGALIEDLMAEVLSPLAAMLYPEWGGGALDDFHAFTVQYGEGEDLELSRHMDSSEVTLNLCLGREGFRGGDLVFEGVRDYSSEWTLGNVSEGKGGGGGGGGERFHLAHEPGVGVLHVGQHWHTATRLTYGRRLNLVVWMRSNRVQRSSPAERFLRLCTLPVTSAAMPLALGGGGGYGQTVRGAGGGGRGGAHEEM